MFEIKKTFEIAGSHWLSLPYESSCCREHGHNWTITVYCRATDEQVKNNNGMVIDFAHIKKNIHDVLDHSCLNEIEGIHNPTAENIAFWIFMRIEHCFKVDVQESTGNSASYIAEE